MKLNERSYPHPVVGNRDDVPGAAFQAALEMSSDKESIYLDVKISCSSTTIINYVTEKDVCYLVHVDCSNTFFRKSYRFFDNTVRISIPAEHLNDSVEVNVFAVAANKIDPYRVSQSHPDYGEATFEVNDGDILAVSETVVFPIESQFDSMRRIGSIMQINESSSDGDQPVQVEFSGEKIVIYLSKPDFRAYRMLKTNENVVSPLTSAIVLPVLIEALHSIKDYKSDDESQPKWVSVLDRKITSMGLKDEKDNLVLAQRLLELPIKRALSSAYQLAESLA
jgi:hypothetical protein